MPIFVPTTWNPSDKGSNCTLSNGNLTADGIASGGSVRSVVGVSSGKWYWELKSTGSRRPVTGVMKAASSLGSFPGDDATSWAYYGLSGGKYHASAQSNYGATWGSPSDTIGVLLDMDAGTLAFAKNGVSLGTAFSGISGVVYAATGGDTDSAISNTTANFGASPFVHTPPDGYNAGFGGLVASNKVAGVTLNDAGIPAPRRVRVYRRSTGALLAAGTSGADGLFELTVDTLDEVYVVGLDDDSGTAYNALIFDRVEPIPE